MITRFSALWERLRPLPATSVVPAHYVDLAPTDAADTSGVYTEALKFATGNDGILNIALTGPYGSGKSSIIRTFLKTYNGHVLQVSLAAFLADGGAVKSQETRQEIERSILQQLLYGPASSQLRHSRFKRIQVPGRRTWVWASFIVIGVLAVTRLVRDASAVLAGSFFGSWQSIAWFNSATAAVGFGFAVAVVRQLYASSMGLSLASISLKDLEIKSKEEDKDSILNRHLDEIIYFFEATKYDLVVIEDLDRFNEPSIFVTLREINGLINQSDRVRRKVRFLYALRDDMFDSTDRTKFFEFIIPVIPVINSSNAIDMMLKQGKRLALDERLETRFLREVSRYLDDLRLIQNIFNEYAVYQRCLDVGGEQVLDATKLLAVLIYKNVFPRDFEDLHRGKGHLAAVLRRHGEFVRIAERNYEERIKAINEDLDEVDRLVASDLNELRSIYAMALVQKVANNQHMYGNQVNWQQLAGQLQGESLDQLLGQGRLQVPFFNGGVQALDISRVDQTVDRQRSYRQRKDLIEGRATDARARAKAEIAELRRQQKALQQARFGEVLREGLPANDPALEWFGDRRELVRFLLFEGYLDDSYYQYTSLFHEGRLSPNDNRFLILIRGFTVPEPAFPLDNVGEVIAAMREEDFGSDYALNIRILDALLAEPARYGGRLESLVDFIKADLPRCEALLVSYYEAGKHVPALLSHLVGGNGRFVDAALATTKGAVHAVALMAHLPDDSFVAMTAKFPKFAGFLSAKLPQVLTVGMGFDVQRLVMVGAEVDDLAATIIDPSVVRLLAKEGLYALTAPNIDCAYEQLVGHGDLPSQRAGHYTAILEAGEQALCSRVERELPTYVTDVLLQLRNNKSESVNALLALARCDDVRTDDLSTLLVRQSSLMPSIEDFPSRLHEMLVEKRRIEPSWTNCIAFRASPAFEASVLTEFMNDISTIAALDGKLIPSGDEAKELCSFIFENGALTNVAYRTYVRSLPWDYTAFPDDVGEEKLQILIDEAAVEFSPETVRALGEQPQLQTAFVRRNFEAYLASPDDYALEDTIYERLLETDLGDQDKYAVAKRMDMSVLPSNSGRAGLVATLLARVSHPPFSLDAAIIVAMVRYAKSITDKLRLAERYHEQLSDSEVRTLLAELPDPYSRIKPGHHTVRLSSDEVHDRLCIWLKKRSLISSWTRAALGDIRVNMLRR